MIHGLDTGFLVAAEVLEHAEHIAARDGLARLLSAGDLIAIAPQVLAEFIHIVTDPRRFAQPLDMTSAHRLAEQWWTAREVVRVFPDAPRPGNFSPGCSSSFSGVNDYWTRFWPPPMAKLASNPSLPRIPLISQSSESSAASRRRVRHRPLDSKQTSIESFFRYFP